MNVKTEVIKTTTIDFLRHGQCVDGHCYRGSSNVSLTQQGWRHMQDSLAVLEPRWQRIISSPLSRCADFAKHIADQYALPLHLDNKLKEIHFGEWEGQNIDQVWKTQQAAVMAWWDDPVLSPPPQGEAADDFAQRVLSVFFQLLEKYCGEHWLLISHGGVMRIILSHCLSMPLSAMNTLDIPYSCLSRLQVFTENTKHFFRLMNHNTNYENGNS